MYQKVSQIGIPTRHKEEHDMNRRRLLQMAGGSVAAGAIGMLGEKSAALAQTYSKATRGLPALKITNVKTIQTCPQGGNYVVVKVETSEPGLYGVRSEEHTSELQSQSNLVCRLLLEKKKKTETPVLTSTPH